MVDGQDAGALNCYWLAQWYHQSPEHFLAMPLSQIDLHMIRTNQIAKLRRAQEDASDGN